MGSNANIRFNTGKIGSFSIGYDVRHELIRSNKLGDSLSESIPVKGENDKYYTLGKSRTSTSLFIEESIHVKRLSLSGGLLTSFLNALPEKIAFYPGIDISYNLNKGFRVYASANRTLRLPTFTDLYYNDNTSKGDPNLKPEEAICIETGVKYNIPGISAHAAVFKRYGHNMIDLVKLQSQDPWQAMNITDITVSGFETNVSINIAELSENTFFIQNISLGYTFLSADKSSDEYMSRYVLDILKHKADLLIYHRIWKGLSASWAFCFQDRNGGYIKYNNTVPENVETPYNPFFTIDLKINYQYKNWKLFAGATNLLNNEYVDFGNITQPGIWISAGVEFSVPYSFSKHK
jgi:iron complex outermembrane receptor protein